jgi:hypothetical protein
LSKNSVLDDAIDSKTKRTKANAPMAPMAMGISFFLQAFDVKKVPWNSAENAFIA